MLWEFSKVKMFFESWISFALIIMYDSSFTVSFFQLSCYRRKYHFKMVVRTYNEEMEFLERASAVSWRIKKGFVPNMNVRVSRLKTYYWINT